jgi:hypothetical protein
MGTLTAAMGHERRIRANAPAADRPRTVDPTGGQGGFRLGPLADSRVAKRATTLRPGRTLNGVGRARQRRLVRRNTSWLTAPVTLRGDGIMLGRRQ